MNERVSIPLPAELAAWLKRESERLERPVAFVARKAIEAARREAQTAAAAPCREYLDAPAARPPHRRAHPRGERR
jgi:predicted transcriptional regulator